MQPDHNQPASEDATPEALVPPRLWWLKRLGLAGVLLLISLVVVHSAAIVVTKRTVVALVKTSRDAGEPVYPDDFNPSEHLPPERDAAALYIRAAGLIAVPSSFPADVNLDSFRDLGFIRSNLDLAADLVNTNGEVLALLHRARELSEADWGIRTTSPMISVLLPAFQPQRTLSRMTSTAVIVLHAEGADAQSVETVRDALHHADLIDRKHPLVITHLIALSCRDTVLKALEVVTPQLRVDLTGAPIAPGGAASMVQVRELIVELLASDAMQESLRAGILWERASVLDTVNCICDGTLSVNAIQAMVGGGPMLPVGGPVTRTVMKPLWQMDAAESFRFLTSIVEAHEHDNYVAVTANLPADPEPLSHDILLVRPSMWMMPSLMRQTQLHFRGIAMRRMAAIALALRLYEVDHGRRPESLDELVPEYLAAVPLDPFDGGGGPIRYLPNADPPLLYSINIDGVDNRGEFTMRRRYVDPNSPDLVFFLDGNRPDVSRARNRPTAASAGQVESPRDNQSGDAASQPADLTSQPADENPPDPS